MDEEKEMITVPTFIDDWESPLGSSVGYTVKKMTFPRGDLLIILKD